MAYKDPAKAKGEPMPSLASYTLIKNEAQFIAAHLLAWLPVLDQMVFYDGNSTDGTIEIIKAIRSENVHGHKIKLVEGRDPSDLQSDYVRTFNDCLGDVDHDLAVFIHPDMIPSKVPKNFNHLNGALAATIGMRSFGGKPDGALYEIVTGRGDRWKTIMRRRNPDLGLHYAGFYGTHEEDTYFSAITGDEHKNYAPAFSLYPYEVVDSGLEILHFSDVRTARRRFERMVRCLMNQGHTDERARAIAMYHPRVTLKDGEGFKFVPAEYPAEMLAANAKYAHLRKENQPAHV